MAALVLSIAASSAFAQSTPAATPAPEAAAAPSSPAKKELVQRILKLQQPGIERLATAMTEDPAVVLGGRASEIIAAKVPKDKQEAVAKEIQAEMQKYLKDTVPQVRKSAQQLAPVTIGPMLESKFSEEELRQVVALLESPAYAKYQQLSGEMQQALQAKLVADTRGTVEPRVQALEKAVGERLSAATGAASAAPKAAPKAAAKPATK
ncbi:hypothetical protein [Hydrogenophaga sp. RWCD_12]|uniref:hypothetical protein n=1 Tax=Hydrogenophaga sp. RWCD_12 TaxID=3391190 RepID=UPI003984EBF5